MLNKGIHEMLHLSSFVTRIICDLWHKVLSLILRSIKRALVGVLAH
jgi:hypothetical protein